MEEEVLLSATDSGTNVFLFSAGESRETVERLGEEGNEEMAGDG
jgi:hypothetical protein